MSRDERAVRLGLNDFVTAVHPQVLPGDDLEPLTLFAAKGALRAIASLRSGEMNMGEFASAAGLTDQPARTLRLSFQHAGLIRVTESKVRGATEIRVALTPKGEKIAKLVSEIARISR